MVYSTCSMNPVENEAVVGEVIYHFVQLHFLFFILFVIGKDQLLFGFCLYRFLEGVRVRLSCLMSQMSYQDWYAGQVLKHGRSVSILPHNEKY